MKSKQWIVIGLCVVAVAVGIFVIAGSLELDSGPGFKITRAESDIRAIQTANDLFHSREHRYPTNSEGLGALVPAFLPSVPKDPWGSAYIYRQDGTGVPNVYSSGPNRRDERGGGDDVIVQNH